MCMYVYRLYICCSLDAWFKSIPNGEAHPLIGHYSLPGRIPNDLFRESEPRDGPICVWRRMKRVSEREKQIAIVKRYAKQENARLVEPFPLVTTNRPCQVYVEVERP